MGSQNTYASVHVLTKVGKHRHEPEVKHWSLAQGMFRHITLPYQLCGIKIIWIPVIDLPLNSSRTVRTITNSARAHRRLTRAIVSILYLLLITLPHSPITGSSLHLPAYESCILHDPAAPWIDAVKQCGVAGDTACPRRARGTARLRASLTLPAPAPPPRRERRRLENIMAWTGVWDRVTKAGGAEWGMNDGKVLAG